MWIMSNFFDVFCSVHHCCSKRPGPTSRPPPLPFIWLTSIAIRLASGGCWSLIWHDNIEKSSPKYSMTTSVFKNRSRLSRRMTLMSFNHKVIISSSIEFPLIFGNAFYILQSGRYSYLSGFDYKFYIQGLFVTPWFY